jgi:hypothetical protein
MPRREPETTTMPAKNTSAKYDPTKVCDLIAAARDVLKADRERNHEAASIALEFLEDSLLAIDPPIPTDPVEMLATLKITKTTRRAAGAGTWAIGTIAGHDFEALVFLEHAVTPSYELDRSRISKLHLKEQATGNEVACFDRGWDTAPATAAAQQIVDLLAAGLAETVFGK